MIQKLSHFFDELPSHSFKSVSLLKLFKRENLKVNSGSEVNEREKKKKRWKRFPGECSLCIIYEEFEKPEVALIHLGLQSFSISSRVFKGSDQSAWHSCTHTVEGKDHLRRETNLNILKTRRAEAQKFFQARFDIWASCWQNHKFKSSLAMQHSQLVVLPKESNWKMYCKPVTWKIYTPSSASAVFDSRVNNVL